MELFASHPTGLSELILFFLGLMGCLFHNSLPTVPGRRDAVRSAQCRCNRALSQCWGLSSAPQTQPSGFGQPW